MNERFQFVWWGSDFACWGWSKHVYTNGLAHIYRYSLSIGPLEIRRWRTSKATQTRGTD